MSDRIRIKDISLTSEGMVQLPLLVLQIEEKKTRYGKPYCSITFSDGESQVVGNFWDVSASQIEEKYLHKVANVTLETGNYVTVKRMSLSTEFDSAEFVRHAPISSEEMFRYITDTLTQSLPRNIARLALDIYDKNKEKLIYWSAAMKMHHNYYGGLLYHVYRMMQAAKAFAPIYEGVDDCMLLVGVALHDIGKLDELETDELGTATFTSSGNLFGHTLSGILMIQKAAEALRDESSASETYSEIEKRVDEEDLRLLIHMLSSHHGELELGAIVQPTTKEAYLLHQLDMMDSKMWMYENAEAALAPGQVSNKQFNLGGIRVYCPDYPEATDKS